MTHAEIWLAHEWVNHVTLSSIGHTAQFLPLFDEDDPSTIIIFADGSQLLTIYENNTSYEIIVREECP